MNVEAGARPTSRRVLVVEDDHETRLLLSAFMARAGFRVDAVADGTMALTMVQAQPPDAVLLDAHLPRLDGYSVCKAIKARPVGPVVVMVTAFGGEDARGRALAAGADEFVEKPFRHEKLLEVVERLWAERRDRVRAERA